MPNTEACFDFARRRSVTAILGLSLSAFCTDGIRAQESLSKVAGATAPRTYVEVIVKACPAAETPLEPTNQGKSYDDERSLTREERLAAYAKLGCIDVPIPPEWMTYEMSYEACKGHAGYLVSMQFLQQRQDLKAFPAVGGWSCIPHDSPVTGVAGM